MAFGDKPSRKGSSDMHQREPDEHEGKHVRFDSRITLLLLQYPLIYFFFSFLALRSRATHPLRGSSMKRFFSILFFFRYKDKEENAIDMTLGENKEIDRINLDK